jgi:hypothetical protein
LGGEACAIAFVEKHIADRIIKNLIPLRLQPQFYKPADGFAPERARRLRYMRCNLA